MNEVPFGAANNRRENIVFAAVHIDLTVAPKMKKLGRPTGGKQTARLPCPLEERDRALSTQV